MDRSIHRTLQSDASSISTLLGCPKKTTGPPRETTAKEGQDECLPAHDSSNPQPTIIIAILLVFILLLVFMLLLYRRHALCFGKVKKQKMTDNNIRVELQDVENYEEPEYEVCYYCGQDSILSRA